jgi:hypothetical protein
MSDRRGPDQRISQTPCRVRFAFSTDQLARTLQDQFARPLTKTPKPVKPIRVAGNAIAASQHQ